MNRHSVAVVFVDFQKAFDFVCHYKLLVTVRIASWVLLASCKLLEWIKSFYPIGSSVLGLAALFLAK